LVCSVECLHKIKKIIVDPANSAYIISLGVNGQVRTSCHACALFLAMYIVVLLAMYIVVSSACLCLAGILKWKSSPCHESMPKKPDVGTHRSKMQQMDCLAGNLLAVLQV
jgi:hypothetical protein